MPLQRPRPRGTVKQHGRRPFRGAVQMLLLLFKSLAAQVGRFSGSSFGRSRVDQLVFMTVRSARLAVYSLDVVSLLTGLPVLKTPQGDHFFDRSDFIRRDRSAFLVSSEKSPVEDCATRLHRSYLSARPGRGRPSKDREGQSPPARFWFDEERPRRTPGADKYAYGAPTTQGKTPALAEIPAVGWIHRAYKVNLFVRHQTPRCTPAAESTIANTPHR